MLSKHEENFMAKLTDTQLIVLSAAVAREDGVAVVPAKMKRATASKVGASLVRRKLMRDSPSKRGMPVWREDEDRRRISLIITRAGRKAIEVAENARAHPQSASNEPMSETDASSGKKRSQNRSGEKESIDDGVTSPRVGTKQALVIEMLCTKGGATLNTLVEATGWLPHTTRAALTGLRKRGFSIERTREEGADSIYRIVSGPAAAAA
jgi:DNA-binding MarR family transcriptional regulator